jgi:hypothetical protein
MCLVARAGLLVVVKRSLETGEHVSMRKTKGTYRGRRRNVSLIPLHVYIGVGELIRVTENIGRLKLNKRPEMLGDGHQVRGGLDEIRSHVK